LACGVRNAVSHQINDRENDLRIGLRTFTTRYRPGQIVWVGTFVVFPVEVVALATILWWVGGAFPILALLAYTLLTVLRQRLWGLGVVIIEPRGQSYMALHSYYEAFFPASLLMQSALSFPQDVAILFAHVALFRRPIADVVLNMLSIVRRSLQRVLQARA
jgi:hypothetical protein